MEMSGKISGITYTPLLIKKLKEYNLHELNELPKDGTFILKIDEKNKISISKWVSPKRTRSYPYARVYDSLSFSGKKVTIIPIYKDEGKDGDRDYLQWDTISLMSLLNVNVIISYYNNACKNNKYENKITNQTLDVKHIKNQIEQLVSYQSDALHWNMKQIDNLYDVGTKAIVAYKNIAKITNTEMHSEKGAIDRIEKLMYDKHIFSKSSRELAQRAQSREGSITQPNENVNGTKGIITITNFYGGNYYFTSDEVDIEGGDVYLIEAKHTRGNKIPTISDIKDGLLKMILFSNIDFVSIADKKYNPIAVLKLTNGKRTAKEMLFKNRHLLKELMDEAKCNKFELLLDDIKLV